MSTIKNVMYPVVACMLILFSVTACIYFFDVRVTGNLEQQVVFQFFKSVNDVKPKRFDIYDFTVYEIKRDGESQIIWQVHGKQALSGIEYGKKYEGFEEYTSAKPLMRGVQYRASASGATWPAPGLGSAGVDFHIDDNGDVIQGNTKLRKL